MSDDAVMEEILAARSDWAGSDERFWDYTASYLGVSTARSDRADRLGIESLAVEFARTGLFRIRSCGVRDGCPRHVNYIETFSLNEIGLIQSRLTAHETAASSIDLQELAWCVVFGDCAQKDLS